MRRQIQTVFCIPALLALGSAASADVISYQRAPLSNVVASLSKQYGVHIVLQGPLAAKPGFRISFTVGVAGVDTNRVQAISGLANAADLSYEKGFVISKIPADETVPEVKIDTDGFVVFPDKTMPVAAAIKIVAGTDNATSQVAADVTGTVTFTDTTLHAPEAAKEIAEQTHTVWRTYYKLLPEAMLAADPPPNLNFDTTTPAPATDDTTADNQTNDANAGPATNTPYQYAPTMTSPYAAAGTNGYSPYGYGASPYGYSPYGYGSSPYGYGTSPYGYGASPYGNAGVGFLPSYGGYGPFGGYGGPPVTF